MCGISKNISLDEVESDIVAISGENICVINHDMIPKEFRRIPISLAEKLLKRSDTQWVNPPSASEGEKVLRRMMIEWSDYISHVEQRESSLPPASLSHSSGRRMKSMIEAKTIRDRKKKWQ